MNQCGPRGQMRKRANAELNKLGIPWCEIRLPGCLGNGFLQWAHSRKSRFLLTHADFLTAARSCTACHKIIEAWPYKAMEGIVLDAISKREERACEMALES